MAAVVSNPSCLPVEQPSSETHKLGIIEDTMNYGERLFHYTYASRDDDVHFLEYRTLHRYNIFHLQNQLAKLKGSCRSKRDVTDETLGDLKTKLHDYSKFLKSNMLTSPKLNTLNSNCDPRLLLCPIINRNRRLASIQA